MKYRVVFDMKTLSVVHTGREFMRIYEYIYIYVENYLSHLFAL